MDVLYRLHGLDFVWDIQKAAANLAKHGIRFEQASEVFLDPLARLLDATADDETRAAIVGETESRSLLFVVHIEREGQAIRLISARTATVAERSAYEDYE